MFKLVKISNTGPNVPEPEYLMPDYDGELYKAGDALVLSDGVLVKASASEKPQFIAMSDMKVPADNDVKHYLHPVVRITPDMVFECPLQKKDGGEGDLIMGQVVTINDEANGITNITSISEDGVSKPVGVATIVALDIWSMTDGTLPSKAQVRFL